ncbi:MAG: NAD+ synthase [Methanobacteriota archaeon]
MLRPTYREDTPVILERYISDTMEHAGADGVVLGLSGGLDSCTVLMLCAKALGPKRVRCLHLPTSTTPRQERRDAEAVAKKANVKLEVVPIDGAVESLAKVLGSSDAGLKGNVKARVRMVVLYHYAKKHNLLVAGTGNKSELLTGYFTKFGDGASDFNPLGDLYKTQVRELARAVGVPAGIVKKPPTAALWEGQTDEGELGISYEMLDRILLGIELGMEDRAISGAAEAPLAEVVRIRAMNARTVHKRRMGLIPKMGTRTVGNDWRE